MSLLSSCSLQVWENQREEVLSKKDVEREVRFSTSDDSVALGKIFWRKSRKMSSLVKVSSTQNLLVGLLEKLTPLVESYCTKL